MTAERTRAAVSANTYWLPRYVQAKAAATVTRKLKMVMTTALTERTCLPNSANDPFVSRPLVPRVIRRYSSLASRALIRASRASSSGFRGGSGTSGRWISLPSSSW